MKMKRIEMKDLIARGFQYGMTMDGVLSVRENEEFVYSINPHCMNLMFDCDFGSHHEFVRQQISLDWQYRDYGCKKVSFICPACGKRTKVLCNSVVAYVCRECNRSANKGRPDDWDVQSHHLYPYPFWQ